MSRHETSPGQVGPPRTAPSASGRRLLAAATVACALSALLLPLPASAQIGGPIGAPVGVPNGLPAGVTGYNARRAGALPPPVNNWSNSDAGRGDFSGRFGGTPARSASARPDEVEVPLPQYQVRPSTSPGAGNPVRDPREQARTGRASDERRGDERRVDARQAEERRIDGRPGDRSVASAASSAQASKVDLLRDLVERGQMHETGLGQARDLNRAFGLYCEAGASGYPDALVRMGLMYADGHGVEKNADAAGTLFRRAARFGSAQGADLAKRYPAGRELLPQCLKGTIVERGTAERPATAQELAAVVQKLDSGAIIRNPIVGAERARLVSTVIAEARSFRLDPRLVLAVMATESGFDPNAKSPKNALGLMQLIPETAERFAVRNVMDPVENIRGGMAYLRWLLSYFRGDVTLTLAAYNAGEGAVDKHNGVPPFTETLAYVQRIRAIYPHDRHPYDPAAATSMSRASPVARAPAATSPATAEAGGTTTVARN